MARHDELLAKRSHVPAFFQATDPALDADNRVTAGKQWVDTTVPSAPVLYVRNAGNSAWVAVSSAGTNEFEDDVFRIQDDGDNTKKVAFEVSGVTTGTTRTLTVPNANTTIVGNDTTDTLTNKTMTDTTNTARADRLAKSGGSVVISGTAPTTGQVLTASDASNASWQTPSGGSLSVYKQTTGGATTFGDSTTISAPLMSIGRVTIPASTTETITVNKGGSAASNIYTVMLTTKGNWSNLVYLEDVAGNVFPKAGSTFTINNNDTVAHDVYITAIID